MTAAVPDTILPARLQKGDLIGLAAPAGPISNGIERGIRMLQEAGLKTTYAQDINRRDNYLAGTDTRRIQELEGLFRDPQVKAIMAVRGGFGCTRLLTGLDFSLIRQHPKILIGFSDLSVLINTVQQRTGLITFHGPVLSTIIRDGRPTLEKFLEALSTLRLPDLRLKHLEILRSGQASGPLIGGNLASLVHLLATPYEPRWQGALLFLEDINEPAYRIDRMLTQLKLAGRLDQVAGIILGEFLDNDLRPLSDIELIWQRVLDLSEEHIPVWANFPVGHGPANQPLPIGIPALMDSNSGCLKFQSNSLSV